MKERFYAANGLQPDILAKKSQADQLRVSSMFICIGCFFSLLYPQPQISLDRCFGFDLRMWYPIDVQ